MKKLALLLSFVAIFLFPAVALAQSVDPGALTDLLEALGQFKVGAWLLGVAVVARILTSIVKGFDPLWKILEKKPELKWVYPALIAFLTAAASAPMLTDNWLVVLIASTVAAGLSGAAAVGWYHGPTWIGGDPLKHSPTPTSKLPKE